MFEWQTPPMIGGSWKSVNPEDFESVVQRLKAPDRDGDMLGRFQALAVRMCQLECYPDYLLLELAAKAMQPTHVLIANFLLGPNQTILLNGTSGVLHTLNGNGEIELKTESARRAYLELFCSAVRSDEGTHGMQRFRIITSMEALGVPMESLPEEAKNHSYKKVTFTELPENVWETETTVLYGHGLFKTVFRLHASGQVEMMSDDEICLVPEALETFVSPWRIYDTSTFNPEPGRAAES